MNVITTENIVKCSESYLTNLPLDHSLIAAAMSGTVMYAVLNTLLGLQYKFAVEAIKFNENFVQEQMETVNEKIEKLELE